LSEPNDEAPGGRGLKKVTNYKLGKRGGKRSSNDIFVGASELDPGLLARTIFHLQGEQMQADTATDLFYKFSEYRSSIGEDAWSIQDFLLWVSSKEAAEITKDIQKNNLTATVRKIGRPRRIPEWIDGPTKRGMGSSAVNLKTIIKPGAVNVILIDGAGRDYGLFLSWFLGMVATWQRAEDKKVPIHHLIDEAQDIFNAGREMASAVGGKLEEQIRKGRSLNISFTICVQSAEAVPEGIRNNLNSQLIHRHNNYRQAKDSITRATEEQVRMTDSFGPGECLANIFGTNAVIHCQMRRAISNLTKEA